MTHTKLDGTKIFTLRDCVVEQEKRLHVKYLKPNLILQFFLQ